MLKSLLIVESAPTRKLAAFSIPVLLLASAGLLAIAPLYMPESYRWIMQSTSESAAQGLVNAWVSRLAFVLFGLAVLWIATAARSVWARGVSFCHMAFGALMVLTAAFSHRPWIPGVPFDDFEDLLHSFTATAMGFAFVFGIVLRLLQRRKNGQPWDMFDAVTASFAAIEPLLMSALPEVQGLLQRMMFGTAYLWYVRESILVFWRSAMTVHD